MRTATYSSELARPQQQLDFSKPPGSAGRQPATSREACESSAEGLSTTRTLFGSIRMFSLLPIDGRDPCTKAVELHPGIPGTRHGEQPGARSRAVREPACGEVDVLRLDFQLPAAPRHRPSLGRLEQRGANALLSPRRCYPDVPDHSQIRSALQHVQPLACRRPPSRRRHSGHRFERS